MPQVHVRLSIVEDASNIDTSVRRHQESMPIEMDDIHQIEADEIRLAKVSLMIVFIFILCHSARWIPNVYELCSRFSNNDLVWKAWVESVTNVSNFLVVLSSSVNFFIYYVTHYRIIRSGY